VGRIFDILSVKHNVRILPQVKRLHTNNVTIIVNAQRVEIHAVGAAVDFDLNFMVISLMWCHSVFYGRCTENLSCQFLYHMSERTKWI